MSLDFFKVKKVQRGLGNSEMGHYKEKILWIIGGIDREDEYDNARAFVKSFGLKCDCVGWCSMEIESESDFALLEQIKKKAKEEVGYTRFCYKKSEYDYDTEWYVIKPLKQCDYEYGEGIKGYKLSNKNNIARSNRGDIFVSLKFLDFCKINNFTGVNFDYVYDRGKYFSKEYFLVSSNEHIKKCVSINDVIWSDYENEKKCKEIYKLADSFGGNLSRIANYFNKVQDVEIPIKIFREDEPPSDFAFCCIHGGYLLVRKQVAEKLVKISLLNKKELYPVMYADENIHKIIACKCDRDFSMDEKILESWRKKELLIRKRTNLNMFLQKKNV